MAPPIVPGRILRVPQRWDRYRDSGVTAQQLYELCERHPSGVVGVAREIGAIPKTIHRHLKWSPESGKPAPKLSWRVDRALRRALGLDS